MRLLQISALVFGLLLGASVAAAQSLDELGRYAHLQGLDVGPMIEVDPEEVTEALAYYDDMLASLPEERVNLRFFVSTVDVPNSNDQWGFAFLHYLHALQAPSLDALSRAQKAMAFENFLVLPFGLYVGLDYQGGLEGCAFTRALQAQTSLLFRDSADREIAAALDGVAFSQMASLSAEARARRAIILNSESAGEFEGPPGSLERFVGAEAARELTRAGAIEAYLIGEIDRNGALRPGVFLGPMDIMTGSVFSEEQLRAALAALSETELEALDRARPFIAEFVGAIDSGALQNFDDLRARYCQD